MSLSALVWDILLPVFVYGDCMAVCSYFIHLSAMGVAEIAESTNLKGCPHTFVYIVYNNLHMLNISDGISHDLDAM